MSRPPRDWLGGLERLGNRLPDPTTLFLLGALAVLVLSQVAVALDWSVTRSVVREGVLQQEQVRAVGLLTSDGLYWVLSHLVDAFMDFPPLGVVLVGMLGIGVAEKSGFIATLLRGALVAVPPGLLTPAVFFVGVMSSIGLDAGYVVLPPVAAALYRAMGRSPLVGIAAVFAGVSAGFSANLIPTSLDPMLAELSTASARLVDPDYAVAHTANWWFIAVSTVLLTGVGWAVTAHWVEPRLQARPAEEGGPAPPAAEASAGEALSDAERRALALALGAAAVTLLLFAAAALVPGAPLHGQDGRFPRWVQAIVPVLFIGFLVPGVVYGVATGRYRRDRDVAASMSETMASMGSYVVMAFFAAQFIAWFAHSRLGEMLALAGGQLLARAGLPDALLMSAFVGVVMLGNLLIGSMSAKYALIAPVFVPMFMQVGISPELTQAAYRVGDSVTNVVTPLNPYVVILLVFVQRHFAQAGIGTLLALMLPYAIAFAGVWTLLLVGWIALGLPLGPAGPLAYPG